MMRWAVFTAVVCGSLLTGMPAASAHGASGAPIPDAAHYLTKIAAISPAVPGVGVRVDPRGEWLEVSNTTGQTLTVLGYAREPYLRIDPAGVWQNIYSPTLALNQSLFGDISRLGDVSLPPNWQHTGDGHTVRWHDHRIHWMGADRPPVVQAAPGMAHLVGDWVVHLLLASTPITVTGTLNWLPVKTRHAPRTAVLILCAVGGAGAVVATLSWIVPRRRAQRRPDAGIVPAAAGQPRPSTTIDT